MNYKDSDLDYVPDYVELYIDKTDPDDSVDYIDTDEDEVPDYIELQNKTNINNPYDYIDTDKDGVPDYVEQIEQTDPEIPTSFSDTNDNGIPDYTEQPVDEVLVNSPLTISETDKSYEKTDLVIDGTTVTINGTHAFNSITLQNGAVLTHSSTTTSKEYKIELYVNQTVNIDSSSRIDVSCKGYCINRTIGNKTWYNGCAEVLMGVMEVQIIQMSNVLFTVTSWIQTNLAAEPVNGKHAVPEEVLFV